MSTMLFKLRHFAVQILGKLHSKPRENGQVPAKKSPFLAFYTRSQMTRLIGENATFEQDKNWT